MNRSGFGTVAFALVGLLAAPAAWAQEQAPECEFEGSSGASEASEALQQITEESTPEAAEAAYREALGALEPELEGDNAVVYLLATQAYLGLQDFERALETIERFDALAPECAEHSHTLRYNGWVQLYNEGIQAYNAGDDEAALESFRLASEFHTDLRAYNNAALLQAEMGNYEGAMETYESALEADLSEADPDQVRALIRGFGDLALQEGHVETAMEAYGDYLAQYPDDVVIRIRYGLALAEAGNVEEAAPIFAEVLARDASALSTQQWVEVGVGLYNARDYENATAAFERARNTNPYHKEATEGYVNASVQAGRPGEVLPLADSLVLWYPYDASNHQLRASALAKAGMDQQAMEAMVEGETTDIIFHAAQMAPAGEGTYLVRGSLQGRNGGEQVTIPFEFLDASGQVVATETLTTQAPASGSETFRIEIASDVPLAGFRYKTSGG